MHEHATNQTRYVAQYFNNERERTFVEIGANDGTSWSCSYHLENGYGWKGICIEPHPSMFDKLKSTRKCTCLNVAVADTNEYLDFFVIEGSWEANMLSGLIDNYSKEHYDRVMDEYRRYGGVSSVVKVKCQPLHTILMENNVIKVDYLSIDTEGSEVKILNSINFAAVDITLIGVEVNYGRDEVEQILNKNGYKFIKQIDGDAFFEKKREEVDNYKL